MFGISLNELLIIILLMVIFLKPKDIPSVVNFIVRIYKKIRNFIFEIQSQIKKITNEIEDEKTEINESFHDRIEKLRLQIENEPEFFDLEEKMKTPKLKIEKNKTTKKK